ncbi:hypothetical protein LEP1GSC074_2423 [Leptospira noguchii str. Hook]|nr:hypothetical protein LEP1GSC074_2423 [Leptospira noguchii str. Hook]
MYEFLHSFFQVKQNFRKQIPHTELMLIDREFGITNAKAIVAEIPKELKRKARS